jgi:hypothetical protein
MNKQPFDLRMLSVLALGALLTGCVVPPPQRVVYGPPPPPPPPPIVVYPAQGQSARQLDQDRYECHEWAVMQSGFDPSRPTVPPAERVVVQPATPPGTNTAVGAIAGAILGAAIAGPRNAGAGLVLGGVTGAAIGATSDAAEQSQARAEQQQLDQQYAQSYQANEVGYQNYRRAITACLVGRGYTVQ